MVQKKQEAPKSRGRPRAYDPETALRRATDTFWTTGYSGTSFDSIAAATGMNRPSLYAAFGDKHALYVKALEQYWQRGLGTMREALADHRLPLREALMRFYDSQLSVYFAGNGRPRGCFAVGTATTEAMEDAEIRRALAAGLRALDADLEARFQAARDAGELGADADPAQLAVMASAILHSIAIRARTGTPRARLREIARKAIAVMCP